MPNVTPTVVAPRPRTPLDDERHVVLPSKRSVRNHALRYAAEVVLAPSLIFYGFFVTWGLKPALLAALAWSSIAVLRRVVTGQRIPATLALSMTLLLARTTVSWMSDSVFLYFLQPTLTTFVTASILIGSVVIGKPFAAKALQDYVPSLPTDWSSCPHMQRFFVRCSLMWGVMYLINASINTWALMSQSLGPFMLISKTGGTVMVATCTLISVVWGLRCLKRDGIHVTFEPDTPPTTVVGLAPSTPTVLPHPSAPTPTLAVA